MIEYRMASAADCRALAALRWEFRREGASDVPSIAYGAFVEACTTFLQQGLASQQWVYWIAVQDGVIVSHIFVQRIAKVPKPERLDDAYGYVTNVYTRPAQRRQGMGAELLTQVVRWAKHQDLEMLVVWPSPASIHFYERAGFTRTGEMLECVLRADSG